MDTTADLEQMAAVAHSVFLELQAAGFNEQQSFSLTPLLTVHALVMAERHRET